MKFSQVAATAVFIAANVFAQEFRSTISGAVSDPTGAGVPKALVTAKETRTNTKSETTTDSAGQYAIPFLVPGQYELTIISPGFKEYVRKNIALSSSDHLVLDARLSVGDSAQSVEVTESVPLINSENASTGQSITTKQVEDMPLNGRTPMMLAQLAMGVISTTQPSLVHPFDAGAPSALSIGGLPSQTTELLLDGSPDATWDLRLAYSPPQDAVQEVRVKAFDTDAAYGHTGSGTANQILKSGTNALHGSLWEFVQPNNLAANTYFNNKAGAPTPVTHQNQYGLTAGGPIFIPKVYDGRDKLFWFFAWESMKDSQPNSTFLTVPTPAERMGDFSALVGAQYQLYDPNTAVLNNGVVTRQPFVGNKIPANRLNPIALKYLDLYPLPNLTQGVSATGVNNYLSNAPTNDDFINFLGRMDYNMSVRSRLNFDIRHTDYTQTKNNYFNNVAEGSSLYRQNWGGTIDEVYTLTPHSVLDVRFNFTRLNEGHGQPGTGYDPALLGFPGYLASNSNYLQLPIVSLSTFQAIGGSGANKLPSQSSQLFGSVVNIFGKHTLKTGGDLRLYRLNVTQYSNSSGTFSFGNTYVRASSSASGTVAQGQDLASFLLGLPSGGSFDINTASSFYSWYGALFVQDDWRVSRTLTLNLGLRYDHETPYTEKYGRTVNGFDTTSPNPLAPAALAAYAKNPLSLLPVSAFAVNGGLTFPSSGGSSGAPYQIDNRSFSPRFGFAWSPAKLKSKTSIRGGFAMFVSPIVISNLAVTGAYSTNPIINQQGFSATTTFSVPGSVATPQVSLSNPFPGGFLQPAGSSAGLATFNGQTVTFLNPNMQNPYSLRWNFDIQHTLGRSWLIEAAYIGNHAVHLPVSATQLNALPARYQSTLPTRDNTINSTLSAAVPNPFSGLNTSLNTATTTVAQLLAPYPEFPVGTGSGGWSGSSGVVETNLTIGSSYFHALALRVEKRLSGGLSLTANYMHSKLIERDSWLNATDPGLEKRISPFDRPDRFVMGTSYEIPVGRGRRFDPGKWANLAVGGWGINGIYTYQVGAPIVWTNGSTTSPGDYVYTGGPGSLQVNARETNTAAFNTGLFVTNTAQTFAYHIRTFSTTFPNLRSDGINQLDMSMLKRFNINERTYFQLRVEAFNVANHAAFSAPNVAATNASFGLITAQANRSRQLQLGARFVF